MTGMVGATVAEMRDALAAGEVSAMELAEAHIAAAEAARPLNGYVTVTPERARAQAAEADARLAIARGQRAGRLTCRSTRCTLRLMRRRRLAS